MNQYWERSVLLENDLKKEYKRCAYSCRTILRANCCDDRGFVFYRFIDFNNIFKFRETNNFKIINIIYPTSKIFFEHPYESIWIEDSSLNIVSSFALVYISTKVYLHTLPVWERFLKKLIRLFRNVRVDHIRF